MNSDCVNALHCITHRFFRITKCVTFSSVTPSSTTKNLFDTLRIKTASLNDCGKNCVLLLEEMSIKKYFSFHLKKLLKVL